ncbi:MAG: flagellar hook-associated protein FlgK [Anaerolineae bacterium]|nr:flagellar hook-associated protein FlgK [Anaerolineae bacterium]
MPGTFTGLETALRSLRAHQRAIEIVDHNIANVNTEGYSRQKAILTTTPPYTVPSLNREQYVGQMGTGVQVQQVYRYSSGFLDAQMRQELPRLHRWEVLSEGMRQIEVVFQEPSDTGIAAALGRFWQSWAELASLPEDLAARTAVTEAASNLAFALRDADSRLRDLRSDMDLQVRQTVTRINDIAVEIAALNEPISRVLAFGDQPNDLRDQRDLLLDELARLVNINCYENQDGTVTVDIGGHSLVMGNNFSQLVARPDSTNGMLAKVVWVDSGTPLTVSGVPLEGALDPSRASLVGGRLGGALYVRDVVVPGHLDALDAMAEGLISALNQLHATGYGMPDSSATPPDRPGSALGAATLDPLGPVTQVLVNPTAYPPEIGLGAGRYSVVVRDNGGTLEFQVQDWAGRPVSVKDVSGSGTTSDWQALALVMGSVYDSGRGFALDFGGLSGVEGVVAEFEYLNFLSGARANEIDVSAWVRGDPMNVAAACSGDATGDGALALAISRLRTTAVIGGEASVDDYYAAVITELGLATRQAVAMTANAQNVVEHLQRRKDEVSAVDLDEETVNLILYQRAYQAAARVMTAVDEMLDRLINGTGRVGL